MGPDPEATPDDPQPPHRQRVKKTRSRFGCNTCRARKVKCDERPNGCANCEKLHLECSGYQRASNPVKGGGKRTYRSCNNCRLARCKCSGDRPVCVACRENNLQCSYENTAKPSSSSTPSSQRPNGAPLTASTPRDSTDDPSHSRRSSVLSASSSVEDSPLSWLCSHELPGPKHLRVLVMSYFQNFHPLRCFAFIHKPSFLRRLDERPTSSLQDNALLHIVCTLGAQFYALEHSDTVQPLPTSFILKAGCHWAKTAQRLLLENTGRISVEGLMTAQLLYDYALRMAKFSQAFILSALMVRMAQALQINLEYSTDLYNEGPNVDLSTTVRESRRRLMWSCYVTDVLCGSGVDQLMLIHEKDIKIQLPCNDWSFLHERACVTSSLQGGALDIAPKDLTPSDLTDNMGMLAFFIQQTEIRKRVLIYIKHLDVAEMPWLPHSEFAQLSSELRSWHQSLPTNLQFTSSTIYMRKESSQLGALCLFHCSFHQTMCDLFRIGTPAVYKLKSSFHFPPEQRAFQKELQWTLFKSARTLAAIIAEAERHGPRMIGDSWLPTIAYDSNRIMLFYLTQLSDSPRSSKSELIINTIPYLQSNLKALKTMKTMNVVADGLARAAEEILEKLGVDSNNVLPLPNVILDDPYLARLTRESVHGTPSQAAPDYVLNPLSIYRMARNQIPERHQPESVASRSEPSSTPANSNLAPSDEAYPTQTGTTPVQQRPEPRDAYTGLDTPGPNLDMFFAPPAGLDWQPVDIVVGSDMGAEGLLPWVGTSQMGELMFEPPN
ncbi:unnamed protein product [Clonostachys rosea]|uniref:Zn(2)-C6 fungal-type domain-containing protein n=1 Tax=Bionectria ochroleuca TaxID=29856 RepID=A0ABY6U0Y9_BIOOC|nr:unnamed protein product [Clonostachys rosea]